MNPKKIKEIILKLDKKKAVKFMILFGSTAKKMNNPLSDIDIAVFYDGDTNERFKFRIKASGNLPDKVDLQIFQDLPTVVQNEILTGKLIYYDNFQFMFDEYMKVIREFNYFEKYYNEYLNELRKDVENAV